MKLGDPIADLRLNIPGRLPLPATRQRPAHLNHGLASSENEPWDAMARRNLDQAGTAKKA